MEEQKARWAAEADEGVVAARERRLEAVECVGRQDVLEVVEYELQLVGPESRVLYQLVVVAAEEVQLSVRPHHHAVAGAVQPPVHRRAVRIRC